MQTWLSLFSALFSLPHGSEKVKTNNKQTIHESFDEEFKFILFTLQLGEICIIF